MFKISCRALLTKLSSPLLSDPRIEQVSSYIPRRHHLCYHTWDLVKGTFIGLQPLILPGLVLLLNKVKGCIDLKVTTQPQTQQPAENKAEALAERAVPLN